MSAEAGSGVVVVDKPAGLTSHDVVARIRRLAGTRKVGHAGTLDPMATGVLVVGVNRATRLLGHLTLTEKAYAATIRLGAATATDDAEGEVDDVGLGRLGERGRGPGGRCAASSARSQQRPSAVSAIKVDGQTRPRPGPRRRGGGAARRGRSPCTRSTCATSAGSVTSSTSTSRCAAAAAPTSARSPVTSGRVSASEATSRAAAYARWDRSPSTRPHAWTSSGRRSGWSTLDEVAAPVLPGVDAGGGPGP